MDPARKQAFIDLHKQILDCVKEIKRLQAIISPSQPPRRIDPQARADLQALVKKLDYANGELAILMNEK